MENLIVVKSNLRVRGREEREGVLSFYLNIVSVWINILDIQLQFYRWIYYAASKLCEIKSAMIRQQILQTSDLKDS